ncbi:G4 quadruplex nucleic acid binding protein [Quaeritorhiza haematococci]|nr:G4 quadruplex nucleic acid binding protein [Quaeritorhiza haematococci]
MTEDELNGRDVVVVCNLKPAKMRGVESQAMVLAANTVPKEGETEKVELVIPPAGSKPGDRVYFEGYQGTPDAQLKSKDKVWETVQPHFITNSSRQATYTVDGKASVLKSEKGVCTVKSLVGAKIK